VEAEAGAKVGAGAEGKAGAGTGSWANMAAATDRKQTIPNVRKKERMGASG